jgi:hypothetical protein
MQVHHIQHGSVDLDVIIVQFLLGIYFYANSVVYNC